MTKEFLLFVRLFSSAARGVSVDAQTQAQLIFDNGGEKCIDDKLVDRIMIISSKHKASSMTDVALQDIFSQTDSKQGQLCLKRVKMQIFSSVAVTDGINLLITNLQRNGIDVCVLKGMSLSCLYSIPECRVSCDTDLLINKEHEQDAYRIMKSMGYTVSPRTEYSHHASCTHPEVGLVELHTDLFFEMINDVIFDETDISEDIAQNRKDFTVSGYTFKTLGITENLIYVTMHMIQHFVRAGTSIRQICDILMYCKEYKDQIDWDWYFSLLEKLSYRGIYDVVMSVGVKYMGFCNEELPAFNMLADDLCESFMSDLEQGGWIGKNRDDSFEIFRAYGGMRAQNAGKNTKEYKKYWRKYQFNRIIKSIFPKKERLCARFPFAKNPLLLIPGWFCWLFYGLQVAKTGELGTKMADSSLQDTQNANRLELFEDLGIIQGKE